MTKGGAHEPEVRADGLVADEPQAQRVQRRGRRVTSKPIAVTWQEPDVEQRDSSENDERLRQDKPPHWG